MEEFRHIRKYFHPFQPSPKVHSGEVIYEEIYPSGEIAEFVYCFWQLSSKERLPEPYIYRVVSDGCIDIFFDRNNPADNSVMGFCPGYKEFALGCDFDYIGMRFFPGVFPLLFNVDAKIISDRDPPLKSVLPDFSRRIEEEIHPDLSLGEIVNRLLAKLESVVKKQKNSFDPRFSKALVFLLERRGVLNTESDLDTGLSPRQLRRVFNYYLGTTPKSFAKVVRFQNVLSSGDPKRYYEAGFFDQAHFIKDFKTFYGVTPHKAFK